METNLFWPYRYVSLKGLFFHCDQRLEFEFLLIILIRMRGTLRPSNQVIIVFITEYFNISTTQHLVLLLFWGLIKSKLKRLRKPNGVPNNVFPREASLWSCWTCWSRGYGNNLVRCFEALTSLIVVTQLSLAESSIENI